MMYADDWNDAIVYDEKASGGGGPPSWWDRLGGYTESDGSHNIVYNLHTQYLPYNHLAFHGTVWNCPLADTDIPSPHWLFAERWSAHYGLNNNLRALWDDGAAPPAWASSGPNPFKLSRQSPDLMLLGDSSLAFYAGGGWYFQTTWNEFDLAHNPPWKPWPLDNDPTKGIQVGTAHGGLVTVAFCDGHVQQVGTITVQMQGPAQ